MQMEPQVAPAIWLPTFCHLTLPTSAGSPLQMDEIGVNKQHVLHQHQLLQTPLQLVPSPHGGAHHFVVQQMMPIHLPHQHHHHHATAPAQATIEHQAAELYQHQHQQQDSKLMLHPLSTTPLLIHSQQTTTFSKVAAAAGPQTVELSACDLALHKTLLTSKQIQQQQQKKRKISPSAKRRSRQRLIAFLEAKRKKGEGECDVINDLKSVDDKLDVTTSPTEQPAHTEPRDLAPSHDVSSPSSTTGSDAIAVMTSPEVGNSHRITDTLRTTPIAVSVPDFCHPGV